MICSSQPNRGLKQPYRSFEGFQYYSTERHLSEYAAGQFNRTIEGSIGKAPFRYCNGCGSSVLLHSLQKINGKLSDSLLVVHFSFCERKNLILSIYYSTLHILHQSPYTLAHALPKGNSDGAYIP